MVFVMICLWWVAMLCTQLGAFLLGHLWRFDRFKCLRWSNSPYSGAFKRIMTYTYLITIPLIMIYSFGFAYIKYKEGYIDVGGGIFPKPYTFWRPAYRKAIFPLMMVFSFSWSFEMVTHLEELCFWYFLITAGPAQPDWFHSPYFRLWIGGSISAIIYVPVVTIVYRNNPLGCEARMFTAGSVGDLALTLGFIPILLRFPDFIQKVKAEGVDSSIIVRLRKFYELNVIRIIFRFLMQIPLFALGVDGLKPHDHELNESLFWTDLLSTVAALGCAFSSVCTLLIFFPRSYEAEYQAKEASLQRSAYTLSSRQLHEPNPAYSFNEYNESGEGVDPALSLNKSATFNTNDGDASDMDPFEDEEDMKYERVERRVGAGVVKERWGTRLRDRERKLMNSTKRMGVGLHDALSRRLTRLQLAVPRRRHTDSDRSVSLSFGLPSLSHLQREVTRRAVPSARSARKRSDITTVHDEEQGQLEEGATGLKRKPTYLLTDSPVLRARIRERERQNLAQGNGQTASASVETLSAAYAAGVGSGYQELAGSEYGLGYGHGLGLNAKNPFVSGDDQGHGQGTIDLVVGSPREDDNADVEELELDSSAPPPPGHAATPVTATPLLKSPTITSKPPPSSMPTHTHVHGPRPLKKSSSLSTNATARRALPTPPTTASTGMIIGTGDPLGAAPGYASPADLITFPQTTSPIRLDDPNTNLSPGIKGTDKTKDVLPEPVMTIGHPYATAAAYSSSSVPSNLAVINGEREPGREQDATIVHVQGDQHVNKMNTNTNTMPVLPRSATVMREQSDAPAVTITPGFDTTRGTTRDRARRTKLAHSRNGIGHNGIGNGGSGNINIISPGGGGIRGQGLTVANVSRHNSIVAHTSQINPLVRTFTSPIDFLDRAHETNGNGPIDWSQIGRAV
ncbi:uncharacterized protein FOMMEDRAFT_138221 [Fomitiporia mediterranea MF3/22]|uniref:uncharacterized protein n=1 Tax=Fomitiporia mediterranea (strain MF3/22) TaxID=694068 RepID=UPI0004407B8C|nr:uncharacterized protein FOMMEDRAFT_138221 [Fomitiporia mediterranea MF3/22]EJD08376.1 hypothetical protein FOMMEDRAFT_138221 [Fomitiporia mediterranea MF3/22]